MVAPTARLKPQLFAGLIFLANVSESTPDLIAFEVTCD